MMRVDTDLGVLLLTDDAVDRVLDALGEQHTSASEALNAAGLDLNNLAAAAVEAACQTRWKLN